MSQHTPVPYVVSNGIDIQSCPIGGMAYVSVAGARGRTLAEAKANAAFIVRACNNHYQLVSAIKSFMASITGNSDNYVGGTERLQLEQALADATKETP